MQASKGTARQLDNTSREHRFSTQRNNQEKAVIIHIKTFENAEKIHDMRNKQHELSKAKRKIEDTKSNILFDVLSEKKGNETRNPNGNRHKILSKTCQQTAGNWLVTLENADCLTMRVEMRLKFDEQSAMLNRRN